MKRILLGGFGVVAAALALHGAWVGSARGEGSDDRTAAESMLAQVAAATSRASSPEARDAGVPLAARSVASGDGGADPAITRGPVSEARRALERARGARASGDLRHAEQLEGLAREWAETARDVLRASLLEQQATALETNGAESATRAQRARALLEEDVARRGRAQAELARVSAGGGPFPTTAASATARAAAPRDAAPANSSDRKGAR